MQPSVEELFSSGTLVRPSDQQPNLVHLVRAIAAAAGVPDIALSAPVQALAEIIGKPNHLIFILLDGLGMNLVRRLPAESFLVSALKRELHATCPSTTACALTTVATAAYPERHGVAGWFTYLPEIGITMASLPFIDRFTGESLTRRGLTVQDVLPLPPICPKMTHRPLTIVPAHIAHTPYNLYSRGDTPGFEYQSIAEGVDRIIERLGEDGASYTHLYLPEIDSICHKRGVEHHEVAPLVMQIDAELGRLAEAAAGRARIVVTADHGLIDVPRADQTLLFDKDPLLELLAVPPTGDARLPIFHVREGKREAFVAAFAERFDPCIALLGTDEAGRMGLFGPAGFSPSVRRRFGDFVGIAYRPATLAYHPPDKPVGELFKAVHAGLSPQEMQIPLCVA